MRSSLNGCGRLRVGGVAWSSWEAAALFRRVLAAVARREWWLAIRESLSCSMVGGWSVEGREPGYMAGTYVGEVSNPPGNGLSPGRRMSVRIYWCWLKLVRRYSR